MENNTFAEDAAQAVEKRGYRSLRGVEKFLEKFDVYLDFSTEPSRFLQSHYFVDGSVLSVVRCPDGLRYHALKL